MKMRWSPGVVGGGEAAVDVDDRPVEQGRAGDRLVVGDATEGVAAAGPVLRGEEAGERLLLGAEDVHREHPVAADHLAALGGAPMQMSTSGGSSDTEENAFAVMP